MTYLLDTDHLSILQRQTGKDFDNLLTRMSLYPMSDFAVSVVTLHEQILGCHAFINKAQSTESVAKGYAMMMRLVNSLGLLPLIPFDTIAAATLDRLETQRLQLAKMDARIAAIALARGLTLLTRNQKDFCKVAGLAIEDWTL